jgi:hypothetical protein
VLAIHGDLQMHLKRQRLSGYRFLIAFVYVCLFAVSSTVAAQGSKILKNIPVTQDVAGQTFDGTLTITELTLNDAGELLATGVLRGKLDGGRNVSQAFTDVVLGLSTGGNPVECDILSLDLGPVFLDLLGLEVDLSQITLDITAVAGPGNLLGNLLCAVAGLLDNFTLDAVLANILQSLLNAINQLL